MVLGGTPSRKYEKRCGAQNLPGKSHLSQVKYNYVLSFKGNIQQKDMASQLINNQWLALSPNKLSLMIDDI